MCCSRPILSFMGGAVGVLLNSFSLNLKSFHSKMILNYDHPLPGTFYPSFRQQLDGLAFYFFI